MQKKQNWYVNQRKYHFIYKTTNLVNQKYYVGMHSTDDLDDGYIGSGTRLWRSIQYYGRENFIVEILEFLPDRESLREREAKIINEEFLKDPLCMNICKGGYGDWSQVNDNPVHVKVKNQRMIESQLKKFRSDPEYRARKCKSLSVSMKRSHENGTSKTWKDTYSWVGKNHSEETKQKMRASQAEKHVGEKNSQYGLRWMTKGTETVRVSVEEANVLEVQGWSRGKKDLSVKDLEKQNEKEKKRLFFIEDLKSKILTSTVDRTVRGWANKMSREINVSRPTIVGFMKEFLPHLYETSFFDLNMSRS